MSYSQTLIELRQLYSRYLGNVKKATREMDFKGHNISMPLLVRPFREYFETKRKLLICGKETNGWGRTSIGYLDLDRDPLSLIDRLFDKYESYKLGSGRDRKRKSFWRFSDQLRQRLGIGSLGFVWSNVNKFDRGGKSLKKYPDIQSAICSDPILSSEIEILNPDIVVFLTGPEGKYYDKRIAEEFPGAQFETLKCFGKKKRPLISTVKHDSLPELSFRTYHPGFMCHPSVTQRKHMKQQQCFDVFIDEIAGRRDEIKC